MKLLRSRLLAGAVLQQLFAGCSSAPHFTEVSPLHMPPRLFTFRISTWRSIVSRTAGYVPRCMTPTRCSITTSISDMTSHQYSTTPINLVLVIRCSITSSCLLILHQRIRCSGANRTTLNCKSLYGSAWQCATRSPTRNCSAPTPDSDTNIADPSKTPYHAGTAFTEMQFYPPCFRTLACWWQPLFDTVVCCAQH